jgi:hypothetical membrane protein
MMENAIESRTIGRSRALFGPLAGIVLGAGIVALAFLVPGYSQIRQTVSEIGEVGSPMQLPFTVLLCVVAACLLIFASAIRDASISAGHRPWASYVIGCMAISAAGVGVFSFPHPLHNVFGMSELIGYQAPLVFALTWRGDRNAGALVAVSWLMAVLVWGAIALNLATLDRHSALWAVERPYYGLVQRALFLVWFGWGAIIGPMLSSTPIGRR